MPIEHLFKLSSKVLYNVVYFEGTIDGENDINQSYVYHKSQSDPLIISIKYDKSQNNAVKTYYFVAANKEGLIQIASFKEYDDWHSFSKDAFHLYCIESQGMPDFSSLENNLKVGNKLTIR